MARTLLYMVKLVMLNLSARPMKSLRLPPICGITERSTRSCHHTTVWTTPLSQISIHGATSVKWSGSPQKRSAAPLYTVLPVPSSIHSVHGSLSVTMAPKVCIPFSISEVCLLTFILGNMGGEYGANVLEPLGQPSVSVGV